MFRSSARDRFLDLWQRCCSDPQEGQAAQVFDSIDRLYSESQRFYHNTDHIEQCLEQLERIRDRLQNADAAEMAIWFHDVIYRPLSKTNENESAIFFRQSAANNMQPEFVDRVCELIMYTLHNGMPDDDSDGQYVVDIDLFSLGQAWELCKVDSDNVRAEKSYLSDEEYINNQKAFFQGLIARPSVFLTDFFRQHREGRARENIHRQLDRFEKKQI